MRWGEEGLGGIELSLGMKVLGKVLRSREGLGKVDKVASLGESFLSSSSYLAEAVWCLGFRS